MPARKGSGPSSAPSGARGGRMARRRGSSAEAAVQAEVARLGNPDGVLRRGFLVKKGHVMPTRKERYFVLGQHSLSYYKPTREGDVELKGVLELKASDVISPMPHSDVWLRIRQSEGPDGKSYKLDLKASNLQERREWIESLRKACRGELLLRQRTLQSDMRLLHARASQRDRSAKAMAELLSSPMAPDIASSPQLDLRASFQILHEMLLLRKLVDTIKSSWGGPSQWSMAQYQELVQGISLAQEKSGSSDFEPDSILAEAFKLRYQFEEIPENQRKLSRDDDLVGFGKRTAVDTLKQAELDSPVAGPPMSPRIRCPSFHSYYATFEELSGRVGDTIKAAATTKEGIKALTPRSATLARYAHLYLLDDIRAKQPWSLDRASDDDLVQHNNIVLAASEVSVVEKLAGRFDSDRIYTYINHHTMVVINPYRLLQTARFTSIYDEQVVLTYADTTNAEALLAPHPFAIAKQSLVRLFFDRQISVGNLPDSIQAGSARYVTTKNHGQTLFICGESGSGKTELAKDLLKYFVLVARPALRSISKSVPASVRQKSIKLFTSSTKSTVQMRTEEARTIALLEAKGVDSYELVLLDLNPERWEEMTVVSRSKRLPQVHVDGLFFGFYDKLERLEDEEQLRMYFKNPHAAKKLSTVLDSNIILEAFGHATTQLNLNSSRFGKVTTLQVSFGLHPWEFQIRGCQIVPFLLEKSRVTSERSLEGTSQSDMNFHVLYAMVAGVNAYPSMHLLAKELRLDGMDCSTFKYLGRCDHKLAEFITKQDTWKKDVERWQQIIEGMDELNVPPDQQKSIFKLLSAVLWLGNIDFGYTSVPEKLVMSSVSATNVPERVVELLGLESVGQLERMLMTKNLFMQSTGESFEVTLEKGQVNHGRDTLARLLYQLTFDSVVAAMNKATQLGGMSAQEGKEGYSMGFETRLPHAVSPLKIVDVYGFEDLAHNSLDQLCINYLSEKLYAREEQVVLAAYNIGAPPSKFLLGNDEGVLFIYEHPLGVFASLEELTILHQSENESAEQEGRKNKLFVRNIYERNQVRLPEPPRILNNGKRQTSVSLSMLPFVIPHTRGNVVYDATDFVKKNSDFAYANLLDGLKASGNAYIRSMLEDNEVETGLNRNATPLSSAETRFSRSKSFVGKFRSHVNELISEDNINMPFYFHCIRPNDKKQPSALSKDLVVQQCCSQRLIRQIDVCNDPSSAYSAIGISKDTVLSRYTSLLRAPYVLDEVASNNDSFLRWLGTLLSSGDSPAPKISLSTASIVEFGAISHVEKLELLLEDREAEAASKIQSLFLMIMWRYRYLSKKRERRGLSNELLALYGPDKKDTVQKLLTKYHGREDELRLRLEQKKRAKLQEQRAVYRLKLDLQSLCLGHRGGLDAQAVNDILHDDGMRELLQQDEKIVLALRDMSLNPTILESQLADQDLRAFYQKLINFLLSKRKETTEQGKSISGDCQSERSLEDRVLAAASEENRALWMKLVENNEWTAYHDALVEVGEDPELLLFHAENSDFVDVLERFLKVLALERQREEDQRALTTITNLVKPLKVDEEEVMQLQESAGIDGEEAKILELLLSVEFEPSLMAAMNQDSYFIQALQDPVLMTNLQQVQLSNLPCGTILQLTVDFVQLMANPKNFAISAALQQPLVREFLLKLIAISFAVHEQSDEE